MANTKLLIRDTDTGSEQTIYTTFRSGRNEELMYATPLKIEPLFWDGRKECVKNSKHCTNRDEINAAPENTEGKISSFIAEATTRGEPITKDNLRNLLDIHSGKKAAVAHDFHSFFEEFTQLCDVKVSPRRGGQTIDYKTECEYVCICYYIQEYEKKRKIRLKFRSIDQPFFNDFVAFLQEFGLSTDAIWRKTISLKAMMEATGK